MPELPEVETTVNELKPHVVGKQIEGVEVLGKSTVGSPSPEQFSRELAGQKISGLTRRGKYLIFKLESGKFLIAHLRMTGSLLLKPAEEKPEKFVRLVIRLNSGETIHFRDVRRFGRMWLVDDVNSIVGELGVEPLTPEFTPDLLSQMLKDRKAPVKSFLLDQSLIAGIGNMYADESLYRARIHPLQPASSLKKAEIKRLHGAIQAALKQGILQKGASTDTYFRPGGAKGGAHLEFQVAHRKGEECPLCGGPIQRITVNQRGSFFCPKCQKLRR